MIESAAILNENSSFGEYPTWQSITTSSGEHDFHEKLLQLISAPAHTTLAYGATANAPTGQTVACPFIAFQRIANYKEYRSEDTSKSGVTFVSLSELSSLGETTETYNCTRYSLSNLLCGILRSPEMQYIPELIALPESSTQVIQEKEEQETIRADTNQALPFKDLVSALDRISHPTEIEDIPLPFDPDDYPLV